MSDVLDQSEVDALLAAVEGGQMQQEAPPTVFGRVGRHRVDVHVYDFKRPERVSKDQMRALEALHEGFGRNFGAALSGYLRTIVEVNVANIEQLTYSEFIHSLPNPTCFNLLKAEQLDGQLCLEISPLIIYPVIDRLLGGSNADLFIGFELKMGNRAGTMSLCIPYNVIEPIMGVLAAQNWFSYQRKGGHDDHL